MFLSNNWYMLSGACSGLLPPQAMMSQLRWVLCSWSAGWFNLNEIKNEKNWLMVLWLSPNGNWEYVDTRQKKKENRGNLAQVWNEIFVILQRIAPNGSTKMAERCLKIFLLTWRHDTSRVDILMVRSGSWRHETLASQVMPSRLRESLRTAREKEPARIYATLNPFITIALYICPSPLFSRTTSNLSSQW